MKSVNSSSIALLGIAFQNISLDEGISTCLTLLKEKNALHPTKYLAAIGTKEITSLFGWSSSSILNPELLAILRKAEIATVSGKVLIALSKWLGSPVQQEITALTLLNNLILALGKEKKGIFLLGSTEKISKATAIDLHRFAPGLRIVGIATPHVYTDGGDIANAFERDALLLEQINTSNADLLVINFDSPKHEIWFERVKKHLKIPLAIGINSTFKPVQNSVSQDVKKEPFGRINRLLAPLSKMKMFSLINSLKIAWMLLPLVAFHNLNRLVFQLVHSQKHSHKLPKNNILFLSPRRTIAAISLPPLIDSANIVSLENRLEDAASHDILILDFRQVRHIQPEGFAFLINAWLRLKEKNKDFFGFCPTHDIKLLMQLHRTWDLFNNRMLFSADMLISHLPKNGNTAEFYDAIYRKGQRVGISLLGALDNSINYENYIKKLTPIISQKDCIIDFSYCTFVDNSGFAFLLTLRNLIRNQGCQLVLCSLTDSVRQQFRITKVDELFSIVDGLPDD